MDVTALFKHTLFALNTEFSVLRGGICLSAVFDFTEGSGALKQVTCCLKELFEQGPKYLLCVFAARLST